MDRDFDALFASVFAAVCVTLLVFALEMARLAPIQPTRATPTCGGELGKPCGCAAESLCREPCIDCCETVPCPIEGCSK